MDFGTAVHLIARDINELVSFGVVGLALLTALLLLPGAVVLVARRRPFAIVSLVLALSSWAGWVLHYSIESPNLGLYSLGLLLVGATVGWILLGIALLAPWRHVPLHELLTVSPFVGPVPARGEDSLTSTSAG